MATNDKHRLWYCSNYGVENKAIIRKLEANDEKYFIICCEKESNWEQVTPVLKKKIFRESLKGNVIYGIGLRGTLGGTNISNISTTQEISALQQTAQITGTKLTLDEHFISAYASKGVSGINELAKRLRINADGADIITENLVLRNHQAIGITIEQEAEYAKRINTAMQKKCTDYETAIAIDNMVTRDTDLVRN